MAQVFWTMLLERSINHKAIEAYTKVAMHAGKLEYPYICTSFTRCDNARNQTVAAFVKASQDRDDTLIMLDADHTHPHDILTRLSSHNVGVVGALAFRRSEPFEPCAFVRNDDNTLSSIENWEGGGVVSCTIVGTGAIAIKRWVFAELEEKGFNFPWFRLAYAERSLHQPGEDIHFGLICEKAEIPHYVDLDCVTPHITEHFIDEHTFRAYSEQMEKEHQRWIVDIASQFDTGED